MRFHFAISFSRPQRELAKQLSQLLTARGYKVFFDEDFEHELLGQDGADYLNNTFFKESHYCIALISESYDKSAWTQLERRAIQAREFTEGTGYLLPILVDGHRPDWLLPTKVYFDLKNRSIEKLIEILCKKVEMGDYGPYRLTEELSLNADFDLLSKSINPNTYWGRIEEGASALYEIQNTSQPTTIVPSRINLSGRFLHETDEKIIAIPRLFSDPLTIFNKSTAKYSNIRLPRYARWDMVTDFKSSNDLMLLGFCGGDLWLISSQSLTAHFSTQSSENADYAYVCFASRNRIVHGLGKTLTIFSFDGKVIETLEAPGDIESLEFCHSNDKLVIGSLTDLYVFDMDSKRTVQAVPITAQLCTRLGCTGNLIVALSGFPAFLNFITIVNADTGVKYAEIPPPKGSDSWFDFTISNDGRTIIALARGVLGNRNQRKLIVFRHA